MPMPGVSVRAFLLVALVLTAAERATADSHPWIQRLVEASEVIVVGTVKDPLVWYTSELMVLTGTGEVKIERALLEGAEKIREGQKLEFRIVHNLDLDFDELPPGAGEAGAQPHEPGHAGKDQPSTESRRLIVFLKRDGKGTLYAEDGFLFTLPHDGTLERLVRHRIARLKAAQAEE